MTQTIFILMILASIIFLTMLIVWGVELVYDWFKTWLIDEFTFNLKDIHHNNFIGGGSIILTAWFYSNLILFVALVIEYIVRFLPKV